MRFRPSAAGLLCVLVPACASTPANVSGLEGEIRLLRASQDQMRTQLQQLENRVTLAEDAARDARNAVLAGQRTIRIAPEEEGPGTAPTRASGPMSTASSGAIRGADVPPTGAAAESARGRSGSDDGAAAGGNRPVIRVVGSQAAPLGNGSGVTVRDGERLPVAPLPAAPGTTTVRPAAVPATPVPSAPDAGRPQSSSLDPRALPAYEEAVGLARGGNCAAALGRFETFLATWPQHPYAGHSAYWHAECQLSAGRTEDAIREFEALLERYPVSPKVPDALFKLALACRRSGDAARADRYAERLLRDHPDSPLAARLRSERNS